MNDRDNKHIIDILFVLALFCLFVLSAIFLISIGANIYSKTMSHMDKNFSSRTAVAYVIEKVHQSDSDGNISLGKLDECDAIIISSYIASKEYKTYIYEYNNELKELTVRADIFLSPEAGNTILPIKSFNINQLNDSLVKCSVVINNEDECYDFMFCTHTEDGGTNE